MAMESRVAWPSLKSSIAMINRPILIRSFSLYIIAQLYDVSADYLLGIAKVDDNHLDVTGLPKTEKHALQSIVDALRKKSN